MVLSEEGSERDGIVLGVVSDLYTGTGTYDSLCIDLAERLVCTEDGMLADVNQLNAEVRTEPSSAEGLSCPTRTSAADLLLRCEWPNSNSAAMSHLLSR